MTILEDFQAVMAQWHNRVILQAIWFVDYPGGPRTLERMLREYAPDVFQQRPTIFPTFGPHIAGVPVYEWQSAGATPAEWQKWPWVVLYPGVWFQFSNGVFALRSVL